MIRINASTDGVKLLSDLTHTQINLLTHLCSWSQYRWLCSFASWVWGDLGTVFQLVDVHVFSWPCRPRRLCSTTPCPDVSYAFASSVGSPPLSLPGFHPRWPGVEQSHSRDEIKPAVTSNGFMDHCQYTNKWYGRTKTPRIGSGDKWCLNVGILLVVKFITLLCYLF